MSSVTVIRLTGIIAIIDAGIANLESYDGRHLFVQLNQYHF